MVARSNERAGPALHAVVRRAREVSRVALFVRPLLVAVVAVALLAGVIGGLLRAGIELHALSGAGWAGRALVFHAALMVCGFLGTVIGIERAVAVKHRAAFVAPLASGVAALGLLIGTIDAAMTLFIAASLAFTLVNLSIVRRQRAAHTVLLLVSAVAWLIGNVMFAIGTQPVATLTWWFVFLVLTIAAERLEMTRLMRRRPGVVRSFHAIIATMLAGAATSIVSPVVGGVVFGSSLALLAAWLAAFDIARRTVATHGLSRYMAVCLLSGYAWLMVSGLAWIAMSLGGPTRDIALHALGLGFVVSMIMGHAPVILPAIARIKLQFGLPFYVPLAMLHLSLIVRLGFGASDTAMRSTGAALNALAIAAFAFTVIGGIAAWRIRVGPRDQGVS